MPNATSQCPRLYPMRIQIRGGSLVRQRFFARSHLPEHQTPVSAASEATRGRFRAIAAHSKTNYHVCDGPTHQVFRFFDCVER